MLFCVKYEDKYSKLKEIQAEVPQGSIMSPQNLWERLWLHLPVTRQFCQLPELSLSTVLGHSSKY